VETHDTYIRSGNVFVSYSKEDEHYVKQLLSLLRNSGLPVWADDRIDFGDRWWRTIVANIRASVAMVIVMTPASENSKWVEREILLADKLDKPLFPVLLQGECHPLLITVQYHDVRDQSMPPQTFIDTLRRLANSGSSVPQMITTRATVARRGPEQERSLVARFFGWLSGRAE
jgi:hypothetical protein